MGSIKETVTCLCHSAATARASGFEGRFISFLDGVFKGRLSNIMRNSPCKSSIILFIASDFQAECLACSYIERSER